MTSIRRRAAFAALPLALMASGPAVAQASADLVFWQTIQASQNPDEYKAYLRAFPHGLFAGLAQVKIDELAGVQPPAQPVVAAVPVAQPTATLAITHPSVRAIDRIELDVDASSLKLESNVRLAVFRAGSPDAIADPEAFARTATAITADFQHLTVPPGPSGNDEVRLLYIPRFGSSYVVAARAPVQVQPPAPGAVVAGELVAEAIALGPVRFEAKYRDRSIKLEGQFLRVDAETSGTDWDAIVHGKYNEPQNIAAVYLGALGTEAVDGAPTEVLCLLPAGNRAVLDRVAAMTAGDDVVITGTPTYWTSAVILDRCQIVR